MYETEMEDLLVNNPSYHRLQNLLDRFNPIRIMNMERMEIRHSAILGWLLDPNGNHGLGDRVLRAFLSECLKGQNSDQFDTRHEGEKITSLQVLTADLSETTVYREWRNIDLLIANSKNNWIFIIENKIDSTEHGDQLNRYLSIAKESSALLIGPEKNHPLTTSPTKIQGIYLTLDCEEPEVPGYISSGHVSIVDVLVPIIKTNQNRLPRPISDFIQYYLEVLEEMTGNTKEQQEMERLARQLYKDHRRIIDFIVEHGSQTALDLALAEFGPDNHIEHGHRLNIGSCELIVEKIGKRYVSLIPITWQNALGGPEYADPGRENYAWGGCENWRSCYPVSIWIEIRENSRTDGYIIEIVAEVGPLADSEQRRHLVRSLREALQASEVSRSGARKWFRSNAETEGKKYSRFFRTNEPINEADDVSAIKTALEKSWVNFEDIICPVTEGLNEFTSGYPPLRETRT